MRGRNKLAYLSVLAVVIAVVLFHPGLVMAQMPNADPELHIVEPIITEETMPNEPGDWDLRVSGSYLWQGTGGSGFLLARSFFLVLPTAGEAKSRCPGHSQTRAQITTESETSRQQ